ncbi:hypothetical protein [Kosakonia pseudosacchari]|uniref:hypothetical protein n=1 Tax=Kosakonia pseudosacchari TaxID=1646340 RepID=UPI001880B7C3|nr:hypothetical protein [Kosakonia pseudosacchari]QOV66524.1 hypothetical protein IP581_23575 [Kosakonia pseudosacchari]
MINESDYKAGWTTPIIHPVTGNMCFGGAARNVRLSQQGGVDAVANASALSAFAMMQPVVDAFQQQLQVSQALNVQYQTLLAQHLANVPSEL